MSQLASDILGYVACGLIWLPFLLAVVFGLLYFIVCDIKTELLRKDYKRKLNTHDQKVLDDYFYVKDFIFAKKLPSVGITYSEDFKDEQD